MFAPSNSLGVITLTDASFQPTSSLTTLQSAEKPTEHNEDANLSKTTSMFLPQTQSGAGDENVTSTSDFVPSNSFASSTFVPSGSLLGSLESNDTPPTSNIPNEIPPLTSTYTSSYRTTIRAKTFDGKVLHFKRKIKPTLTTQYVANSRSKRFEGLLEVPIHRLMERLSSASADLPDRLLSEPSHNANTASTSTAPSNLWVDTYRPKRFADLVGNDRVNRDVMAWVKQWDRCVFGKAKGKQKVNENYFAIDDDEYRRPKEKILLLAGPPGLGKTTLANVIAQQAGYEVMEINASDARTRDVVKLRIQPMLESGSTLGSTKPVLLVIDEIDGATGVTDSSSGFMHELVKLVTRKLGKKGKSKEKPIRPILRPIICICNDINAASLAQLKPHAYQIRVNRPADIHTIQRLREVCQLEGLATDARALSTLVGAAQGDMRGCLNALQFIKLRDGEVTEPVVRRATLNMKETDSSVSSVLNDIFFPLSKKRIKDLALNEVEESRYVNRLALEIDRSGRESNIAIGCFAQYTTRRKHDVNFDAFEKANEWLACYDQFSSSMYSSDGDFALRGYLSYFLVPFHPLFQERGAAKIERDQSDWECLQTTRANEEIYKSVARCIRTASLRNSGNFRYFASSPLLETEFTPYINRIIAPPLRPVNSQVIKPQEKALLFRLVDMMAALEFQFVQNREEDGQLVYRLEPPIDVFVTYDNKRAADIPISRYAVRHLVAQEVDAKLISKRAEITTKFEGFKDGSTSGFFKSGLSRKRAADDDTDEQSPTKRRKMDDKLIDIADRPATDFFGRPITVVHDKPKSKGQKGAITKKGFSVLYKFTEGNSAAVRKPTKVAAFM